VDRNPHAAYSVPQSPPFLLHPISSSNKFPQENSPAFLGCIFWSFSALKTFPVTQQATRTADCLSPLLPACPSRAAEAVPPNQQRAAREAVQLLGHGLSKHTAADAYCTNRPINISKTVEITLERNKFCA